MNQQLQLIHETFSEDKLIGMLLPIVSKETLNSITVLLDAGAYIAGGFAECIARAHFLKSQNESHYHIQGAFTNHFASGSDIDFWCHSQKQFEDISKKILAQNKGDVTQSQAALTIENFSSKTGFYTTEKIQIITKIFGAPQDVISSFDILNAMCFWKNDTISYPAGLFDLFFKRKIHVQNFSKNSFLRLMSWKYRKSNFYRGYSEATKKDIIQLCPEVLTAVIDKSLKFDDETPVTLKQIQNFLLNSDMKLPDELVVLLAALYGQELGYRGMVTKSSAAKIVDMLENNRAIID